jgi:peptidyl-prolyl cis-trans isomerase C
VRALLVASDTDANWDKVAEEYSIDPGTKNGGGDLGSITRGEMVKPISAPVHSQYGWHVIEVTAMAPAITTSFTDAKATIKSALVSRAWQEWLYKAKTAAKVDYAPGYDPVQVVASPSASAPAQGSPSPSPSPSSK